MHYYYLWQYRTGFIIKFKSAFPVKYTLERVPDLDVLRSIAIEYGIIPETANKNKTVTISAIKKALEVFWRKHPKGYWFSVLRDKKEFFKFNRSDILFFKRHSLWPLFEVPDKKEGSSIKGGEIWHDDNFVTTFQEMSNSIKEQRRSFRALCLNPYLLLDIVSVKKAKKETLLKYKNAVRGTVIERHYDAKVIEPKDGIEWDLWIDQDVKRNDNKLAKMMYSTGHFPVFIRLFSGELYDLEYPVEIPLTNAAWYIWNKEIRHKGVLVKDKWWDVSLSNLKPIEGGYINRLCVVERANMSKIGRREVENG